MAAKNTAPAAQEAVETAVPVADPMVTIRIPRDRDDKEDKVVWVNEKRYLIQRGIPVEVPESVAEILRQEEEMLQYIYDFEERVSR